MNKKADNILSQKYTIDNKESFSTICRLVIKRKNEISAYSRERFPLQILKNLAFISKEKSVHGGVLTCEFFR